MAIGSLLQFSQLLITKWWRALFLLMLVLLQLAAIRGPEDSWARGLMLAHFGLFIMWQPFMQAERRLTPSQALAIVAIGLCILYLLNGWLLALWVCVLAGIVGGKVFLFQARWLRRFYLVVLLYLISLLLIWIVPTSFIPVPLPKEVQMLAQYGLPGLFIVMLAIPAEADLAETPQIVDFFYAALIFLLLVALVLGSFAFMTVRGFCRAFDVFFPLSAFGRIAVRAMAAFPRRAFAARNQARALSEGGLPRPDPAALGLRRLLAHRGRIRRFRKGVQEFRRIHQPGDSPAGVYQAALEPFAHMALSPARAAAGRVLHRQAARAEAAAADLRPGRPRNRRAHDARREEPVAVPQRAVRRRGTRYAA